MSAVRLRSLDTLAATTHERLLPRPFLYPDIVKLLNMVKVLWRFFLWLPCQSPVCRAALNPILLAHYPVFFFFFCIHLKIIFKGIVKLCKSMTEKRPELLVSSLSQQARADIS